MSDNNNTVDTTVTKENIDLDVMFGPDGSNVVTPDNETSKPNIFSHPSEPVDLDFSAPALEEEEVEKTEEEVSDKEVEEKVEEKKEEVTTEIKKEADNIIEDLDNVEFDDPIEDTKKETRGRKKINGISDVFGKLIKDDKIVPFDDDKPLDEYSVKDWEELIEANLEERANQVRRETPKQFFDALPTELKVAARYVADGGTDLKGLFRTLSYVEETKELNIENERDQERIIGEYLTATGYGTAEEIQEEIEIWKDLGKLEQQASKFKPKLDKMQEKVVAQKLQEQEMRKAQQEQASKEYMHNVYETLKEGKIGEIKLDKKTQAMLYNGLVQPAYPSVNGNNTNLLGHLLEKYQFVEPNYNLITEALWLLSDPDGYKSKIMEKGAQKSVESTVRKLKTEQANSGGNSLGVQQAEAESRPKKRKIQRSNNIFKRI